MALSIFLFIALSKIYMFIKLAIVIALLFINHVSVLKTAYSFVKMSKRKICVDLCLLITINFSWDKIACFINFCNFVSYYGKCRSIKIKIRKNLSVYRQIVFCLFSMLLVSKATITNLFYKLGPVEIIRVLCRKPHKYPIILFDVSKLECAFNSLNKEMYVTCINQFFNQIQMLKSMSIVGSLEVKI